MCCSVFEGKKREERGRETSFEEGTTRGELEYLLFRRERVKVRKEREETWMSIWKPTKEQEG